MKRRRKIESIRRESFYMLVSERILFVSFKYDEMLDSYTFFCFCKLVSLNKRVDMIRHAIIITIFRCLCFSLRAARVKV